MIDVADVGLKAVPPLITFAAGRLWPVVHQRIRTSRTRRFWRPFSHSDSVRVVLGTFGGLNSWEESGLVGVGDVQALHELQRTWSDNRLGDLEIVFAGEEQRSIVGGDMVLLGGPDVNWVTRIVSDVDPGVIQFGDPKLHVISMRDLVSNAIHSPAGGDREALTRDVGVIKFIPNPFSEGHHVIVIAGAFGFGTWAGPILMRSKAFLEHPVVRSGRYFECLITVPVVAGVPEDPKIENLYARNTRLAKRHTSPD